MKFEEGIFLCLVGMVLGMLLCTFLVWVNGPPDWAKAKKVKTVPINCVIDYHRDGIHYCILEDK